MRLQDQTSGRPPRRVLVSERARSVLRHAKQVVLVEVPPGFCEDEIQPADLRAPFRAPVRQVSVTDLTTESLVACVERAVSEASQGLLILSDDAGWPLDRQMLVQAMAQAHPALRMVLRGSPTVPVGAALGVTRLTGRDLLLSRNEVASGVARRQGKSANLDLAAEIVRVTGGWPALVGIALDTLWTAEVIEDRPIGLIRQAVRGHLARTMASWPPPAWQPLLGYLAIAGPMRAEEVDELQKAAGSSCVSDLLTLGVARIVEEQEVPHLRLGEGLAGVVVDGLRRDGTLPAVLSRVAEVRERIGVLDGGLLAARLRGDDEQCARILDRWWPRLLFGEFRGLTEEAVLALGAEVQNRHPRVRHLAEVVGALAVGEAPVPVPASAAQVRAALLADGGEEALHCSLLAMTARRRRGDPGEARAIALGTRRLADEVAQLQAGEGRTLLPLWRLGAGLACLAAGDEVEAMSFCRIAWADRPIDRLGFAGAFAAATLGVLSAVRGETVEARRWLARSEMHGVPECLCPAMRGAGELTRLVLATDALDIDRCRQASDLFDDGSVPQEYAVQGAWAAVHLAIIEGRAFEALALLDHQEAAPAARRGVGLPVSLEVARAEARLALGQATAASAVLAKVPASNAAGGIARARLHLLCGEAEQAAAVAGAIGARVHVAGRLRTEALVLQAAALTDRTEHAVRVMTEAVRLARQREDLRVLLGVPRACLDQLAPRVPDLGSALGELDRIGVVSPYPESAVRVALTTREQTVLDAIAHGHTQDELARELFVTRNTVKTHVRTLYAKLGAHSKADAIAVACELGLLPGSSEPDGQSKVHTESGRNSPPISSPATV